MTGGDTRCPLVTNGTSQKRLEILSIHIFYRAFEIIFIATVPT